MSYEPQNFKDGEILKAEELNNIETGIVMTDLDLVEGLKQVRDEMEILENNLDTKIQSVSTKVDLVQSGLDVVLEGLEDRFGVVDEQLEEVKNNLQDEFEGINDRFNEFSELNGEVLVLKDSVENLETEFNTLNQSLSDLTTRVAVLES